MKGRRAERDQEDGSGPLGIRVWQACALLYALTFVHLVIQRCVFGARVSPHQLNELWQLPGVQFMKTRPFESIVYWHAYASGFVAYWVLLIKLFGESAAVLVYQWVNITLGAGLGPAAYLVVLAAARSPRSALVAAVIVSSSPSIPLFAAYLTYDLPAMALLTFAVGCIACYQLSNRKTWFLVAAIWLFSALVCLRSFFHIALAVLLLIWIISNRPGWRMVFCSLGAVAIPLAMYLKNYILFGVFGSSTMFGFNLSKVNVAPLPANEARLLCNEGIIPPIVERYPSFWPLVNGRAIYREYGYNLEGKSVLVNQNDFNNINLIKIAAVYGRASRALIRARPREYIEDVTIAFWRFCDAPSRSWLFLDNPARIEPYRTIYLDIVDGEWVSDLCPYFAGRPVIPSMVMLILPVLLLSYIVRPIVLNGLAFRKWRLDAIENCTEWCMAGMLFYGTLLGTFGERGENNRYFLYLEALYICALAVTVVRVWRWVRAFHVLGAETRTAQLK
jgi:hypothetical protein